MKVLPYLSFALSGTAVALSIAAISMVSSNDRVAEAVKREIASNPKTIIESVNGYVKAEQARKSSADEKKVFDNKADIANANGFPFIGNPNGTVTIVYFFDSNCSYCKVIDPSLKNIVTKNSDVKIIHREIPILAKTSRLAAHIANIVWTTNPDKYAQLHELFMAHEGTLTENDIEEILKKAIGDEVATKLLAEIENYDGNTAVHDANNRVQENLAIATFSKITGTPLIVVIEANTPDSIIRGAVEKFEDRLQALVEKARSAKH